MTREIIYYQITDPETMMNHPHTFENLDMARDFVKKQNWDIKVEIEKVTRIIEIVETI